MWGIWKMTSEDKLAHQHDRHQYIFAEDINYFDFGSNSIWGAITSNTFSLMQSTKIQGIWLNVAAGDGRYNDYLMDRCAKVVAFDIHEDALNKLWHRTNTKDRKRLQRVVADMTEKFPFRDGFLDGVLCTATLHFFPPSVFKSIVDEIFRITKPTGRVIIDISTDIKRISEKGIVHHYPNEAGYTLREGKELLSKLFEACKVRLIAGPLPEKYILVNGQKHKIKCNGIALAAEN